MEDGEVRERIGRAVDRFRGRACRDERRRAREIARATKTLERSGGRVVAPEDPDYPAGLRRLARPPIVFLRGPWDSEKPPVAIVGSREASEEGVWIATQFARGLAEHGIPVVSGMARGIDSAAHRGSLAAGGRSGAVLGTPLERCYPREHAALQEELAESLGLVTEMVPGFHSSRGAFVARNRLLAAIAEAVVVVEAREKSGALWTTSAALKLGRPLAAPPWPVWSPGGRTPNELIRSGQATLVRSAEDILELIGELLLPPSGPRARKRSAKPALPELEARVLQALHERPRSVEEIARDTGLSIAELGSALISLELSGWARRDPGGSVRRLGFR